MKVIYTGVFRFPAGDAAAARVLNNAKILKTLGYEVIFISWGGTSQVSDRNVDGNFIYEGFRYINTNDIDLSGSLFKRLYNFIYAGQNALKLIKKMKNKADVVIGYDTPLFFTGKILKFCRNNKLPFIYDITEWSDPNEFPGGKYAPPYWMNNLNIYLNKRRVKNKIVISDFLNKFYNLSNNIIVPPLVDHLEEKWSHFESALPVFEGIRIVYAGSPGKKDLLETIMESIIACIKKGLKLQFVIVGVTKEEVSHYSNFLAFSAYPDTIIFCGRVPQKNVPSYYNSSDFSIIIREPTRKNNAGFPTKLVETMMAGCPVILNYTSDIANYVLNGYNGYIVPDSSSGELEKILSHIVKLSSDDLKTLKNNAMQSALEKFDYKCYVDEMRNFFEKI
jgi:glycosyltransferase involved in cell wall biosynthesis